ncbi:MAG TPA: DUF6152 family protein [Hyphomonadaceae bacterium]
MRLLLAVVATAAALGLGAAPAVAHHGLAQQFDMEKRVVLKGKITQVHWQNPHIYYSLEVMENGKPRTYNIESVPVAMARAAGLTAQKLRNDGKEVEIHVRPGLKDPNVVWGLYLKFSDGSVVTFEGFKE